MKGHPKIRFYAAAPLITKAGHFLGAFAIFDDKPKIEFGIVARRQLSEFAKRVTSDLEQAAMQYYETQARAVELRMDLIENFRVQSSNRADRASEDCKVPELPARSPSRTFMRHRRTRADYVKRLSSAQLIVAENTPPESDYGSDRTLERNKTTPEMERSHSRKQSSTGSKNTFKSARESVVISDPYTPPQSPPRPYLDMTIGSPETPREPRRPPNTPVKDAQRTSMASASSLQTILRIDDDLLPAPLRSASSSTTSKEKLDQLPHTPGPHNAVAEASFAAALVAGSLGYDFLYLLRFSPVDGGTVDKGLTEGGMYNTEVLISHGMPHPIPYFDPALHLRALHASRGLVYQNPNSVAAGGTFEYEFGLLFPVVHSDTERKSPEHSPLMVDGGIESDPDSKNTHPAFRDRHHDHTPKIIEYDTHSNFNETSTTSLNTTVCRSGVILAGFMRKAPVDGKVSSENISEMTKLGKRLKELLLDDR